MKNQVNDHRVRTERQTESHFGKSKAMKNCCHSSSRCAAQMLLERHAVLSSAWDLPFLYSIRSLIAKQLDIWLLQ
ncbi:hypothetical protein CLOSTMETH_02570 [[Clostridium] methylpentosum DSM 5476]|uniref:Uncharacterized protein n=1 Tax=[Clostridium] methylpentosum DSM 5476 TaxID=537013 RepID=C0EFC8_9FIRM|nr:hypothetical protein CLOSTMETH_02570 [[Clostridium] methylpentosum DSM 5476]